MKNNLEIFIKRAKEKYGDKFDYSKVNYINFNTKVEIICPRHGSFWTTPNNFLRCKNGCPKCKSMTTEEFIERAKQVHGNKYDYSKTIYKDWKTKVCIICPIHGEFFILPIRHINTNQRGNGCPKCGDFLRRKHTTKTTEWFIEKAKKIYGDKYDYSKAIYSHSSKNITIICHEKDEFGNEHGEFITTPNRFLQGHGCQKCAKNKYDQETFIQKCNLVHNNKYDYSKTKYQGVLKKIKIICPFHGEFEQLASHHLHGVGCPICNESKQEKEIRHFLTNNNIQFISQYRPKWLGRQSLDFFLKDYNVAIECQGMQHLDPNTHFGTLNRFEKQNILDKKKYNLCKEHGIEIIYFSFYDLPYFAKIITEKQDLLTLIKNKK